MTAFPAERLRGLFTAAGYTVQGVADRLGTRAGAALGRTETTAAYRLTGSGDRLDTLIRLFLLQRPVPRSEVDAELAGELAGVLTERDGQLLAAVDIRPYAADEQEWWVVSDLTPGLDGRRAQMRPDYVLGIAPASLSLVNLTLPVKVDSALDVGTGCGIQALHLAGRAARVVATDVNPRAIQLARWTAALNRVDVDLRSGSLYEPVEGERFDLIVSNPPYVISPGGELTYRETGAAGDSVVEQLVREAPRYLTEGGWCQVLANWTCLRGQDWRDRVVEWTGDRSSWVLQREQLDPAEYVELWLRDAGVTGAEYLQRYDAWLSWLDGQGVEAIGMGWITVHNVPGHALAEEWPYEIEQPIGPHVLHRFEREEGLPVDLTGFHLRVADDVVQETAGAPGAEHPATIVLRRQRGLRRAEQVDTVTAGFVGACDGELTAGQILAALADLLDRSTAEVLAEYLPEVRRLVTEGFLEY